MGGEIVLLTCARWPELSASDPRGAPSPRSRLAKAAPVAVRDAPTALKLGRGGRRLPAAGDVRVDAQYGGRMEAATLAEGVVRQMASVLALLPVPAVYARVDGVIRHGDFIVMIVMEVEVNEPGLGLHRVPAWPIRSLTRC